MKYTGNVIICQGPNYYVEKDEDVFFDWLSKIECVEKVSGAGKDIHIYITHNDLNDQDLRDLLAIFMRYKLNMTVLARFLNDTNKDWFYDNKKAYWSKLVFGSEKCKGELS